MIFAIYSNAMGRGGGLCFFQTHSRDQGSLFLVIFAMYFKVIEERVRFFQTHCREQESLFLVIAAMHSDLMGRGGGYGSFRIGQ